jgi:hypothetical protein
LAEIADRYNARVVKPAQQIAHCVFQKTKIFSILKNHPSLVIGSIALRGRAEKIAVHNRIECLF